MARSKNDVISFDKEDIDGGKHAPAGKYQLKIMAKSSVEPNKAGDGNNLVIFAQISKGKFKGVSLRDYLGTKAKWKIAQFMRAIGMKVKPGMKVTLQDILKAAKGKDLRAILMVENYEGRKNNKVVTWLPLAEAEGEETAESEEEEEEDDEEEEEEEEEEDEDEDSDEDDSDEDDDDADDEDDEDSDDDDDEEDEEDEEDDDEDEDEDEDDDDEEEEAPVTRRAPAKKAAKKAPAKKAATKKKK